MVVDEERDNGEYIGLFVVKRRGETSWLLLMLLLEIVVGEVVVAISCGEEEKGQREMGQFKLKEGCWVLRVKERGLSLFLLSRRLRRDQWGVVFNITRKLIMTGKKQRKLLVCFGFVKERQWWTVGWWACDWRLW